MDWRVRAAATFTSLLCGGLGLLRPTEVSGQTFQGPGLPKAIPAGTFGIGAFAIFHSVPYSTTASVSLDIDEPNASAVSHLKVMVYPGGSSFGLPPFGDNTVLLIWNHEQLRGGNNQVVTKLHLVANLPPEIVGKFPDPNSNPPTFSYTVQVIDDTPGFPQTPATVGTFKACSLTLYPSNPGHTAPPTVTLSGGTNNQAVPAQINFGHPITLVAKAVGNAASYKITRLGIKITEILDEVNPYLNHNSGLGPGLYAPVEIMASSTSGATFSYTPPILPPGQFQIDVTAWDSAGFSRTLSKNLTVARLFGLFSVSNIVRAPDSDCSACQCFAPCVTTDFSATLNLANHTPTASGPLRIRLLAVAGSAFRQNQFPPALPPPMVLTSASIGPVTALPAGGVEHVQISGTVPATIQNHPDFGIGFQIFALLDTPSGLGIDAIKVTEGVWPVVNNGGGPGTGVIAPRPGINGSSLDPKPKLFKNISTRCKVLTGDNVLIAGFIVKGNVPKKVIIRAIGPSLTLAGKLLNPTLDLYNGGTLIRHNDDWGSATNHQDIANTGIPPNNARESAILISLNPGIYTAIVRGAGGTIGTALVEVYDLDAAADSQLINISSRGFVITGNDVMIGGIIVGASGKVVVRAIGPSLPASILNRLQDPTLELHTTDSKGKDVIIATNDNWRSNQAAIQATGLAPLNNNESAIATTLLPGNYTAIIRGKNNTTGVGLVECYNVQ